MWESRHAESAPWTPVRVPQALVVRKERDPVSYRLRFTLPKDLRRDRRAELVFDKAGHHVRVTLNGATVGEHYGVRLPFSFDVTDVRTLGVAATPLAFVRSPELLVVGPAACGGSGWALAAPTSGAGGIERGTLLHPEGKGWLVLTEPARIASASRAIGDRSTTVDVQGQRFTREPGFGHLHEVRLDSTP